MEIKDIKRRIRAELGSLKDDSSKFDKNFLAQKVDEIFTMWRKRGTMDLTPEKEQRIKKEICDDVLGCGPLEDLFSDPDVSEIMVNGPFKVYAEKNGSISLTDIKFDDNAHLRYIIERMVSDTGRRLDESSPYVDFTLPDGSRANIILPPVSACGPVITIRKIVGSIDNLDDLLNFGTLNEKIAEFLVACVKAKMNIIFSGATGSGKTTTLKLLSSFINPKERIITIEDTLEIELAQEHIVPLLTRPSNIEGRGEITTRDLFINTLRMRPSRIILGEIRGMEAMDFIQALNSGHRGSLAVLHGAGAADAIIRLETMALYAGLNIPGWAIRRQIASGLDLIIQHDHMPDGSRKITSVTEVCDIENDQVQLNDIFRYDIEEILDGKVKGKFVAVNEPKFYPKFKKMGIDLDKSIFEN